MNLQFFSLVFTLLAVLSSVSAALKDGDCEGIEYFKISSEDK
jgi:hypothetical protein